MIGGKVVDASALAALVRGRLSAMAWFDTAWALSVPLYLPTLALTEVRAVRPDAVPRLADVVGHPSVVLGELDAVAADQLLVAADVREHPPMPRACTPTPWPTARPSTARCLQG